MLQGYIPVDDLPRALGAPVGQAQLKQRCDDFIVRERLSFLPEGSGNQQYFYLKKTDATTDQAVSWLARRFGHNKRDIGFAGMKDRKAVTTQWFSVPIAADAALLLDEPDERFDILWQLPGQKKLRRGTLNSNLFRISLRDCDLNQPELDARLHSLSTHGFPNYFGAQRFGFAGQNVKRACAWLDSERNGRLRRVKPMERGLFISSLRAAGFNQLLAARVADGTWNCLQDNDYAALAGSNSFFQVPDAMDTELQQRCARGDISPSACLPGDADRQNPLSAGEKAGLDADKMYWEKLAAQRVTAGRRSLRIIPSNLQWRWSETTHVLELSFRLPPGAYATMLLRELIHAHE